MDIMHLNNFGFFFYQNEAIFNNEKTKAKII